MNHKDQSESEAWKNNENPRQIHNQQTSNKKNKKD